MGRKKDDTVWPLQRSGPNGASSSAMSSSMSRGKPARSALFPALLDNKPTAYIIVCAAMRRCSKAVPNMTAARAGHSFWEPVSEDAVADRPDNTLFMKRTESVCANCGAHLGHVFPDGPPPTGLRYCMNGTALTLKDANGETVSD